MSRNRSDSSDSDILTVGNNTTFPRRAESDSRSQTNIPTTNEAIRELESIMDNMPFLEDIDEKKRGEVVKILNFKTLSDEQKLEELKSMVYVSVHEQIAQWLRDRKEESKTNFIQYLDSSVKEMAEKWKKELKFGCLLSLVRECSVEGYSSQAEECLNRWKIKMGLGNETDLTQKLVKEEITSTQKAVPEETAPTPKVILEEAISTPKVIPEGTISVSDKDKKREKKKRNDEDDSSDGSASDTKKRKKGKKKAKEDVTDDSSDSSSSSEESEATLKGKQDPRKKNGKKSKHERRQVSDECPYKTGGVDEEQFGSDLPLETNLVLLGPTGIGKSTLINSIANMLCHSDLETAKEDPQVLIKTRFHHVDQSHKTLLIEMEPTIKLERKAELDECTQVGASATQVPTSYVFEYGSPGYKKKIRIIDTPGIADVRGMTQDLVNFRHIMNFISSFKEIHAFVFVLKPNDSRLGPIFRYIMNELLTHLHVSATKNIIFCMTYGRGNNYKPEETYTILESFLNDIKTERQPMFVFDSEFYRYLCECQYDIKHSPMELKNYQESWTQGQEKLTKMMQLIAQLKPHDLVNTLSVVKVRRAVDILSKPIADIVKAQLETIGMMETRRKEVQECLDEEREYRGQLFTPHIQMNTIKLDHPVTVCIHEDYIEHIPLHENGVEEIVYKQECHVPCYLPNIEQGESPEEAIKNCEVFSDLYNEDLCTKCGHNYEDHQHMHYRLVREVIEVVNPKVQTALEETNDKRVAAQVFVDQLEQEKDAIEKRLTEMRDICAEFAVFLKKNSVLAYNDQHLSYLDTLIRLEKGRVALGSDNSNLAGLEKWRDQYKNQIDIFQEEHKREPKSLAEIEELIEKMKNMKDAAILEDIENLEFSYPAELCRDAPPIQIHKGNNIHAST